MSDPIAPVRLRDPVLLLATGFGSGLIRPAPGTWGTVAGVPLVLLLLWLPAPVAWGLTAALIAGGVPLCTAAGRRLGVADHGGIVIDEIAGFALVALLVVTGPWTLLAAFLAFRFFDIVKPWPISWADRRVGAGLGVMLDDLIAALYAALTVHLLALAWAAATSAAGG